MPCLQIHFRRECNNHEANLSPWFCGHSYRSSSKRNQTRASNPWLPSLMKDKIWRQCILTEPMAQEKELRYSVFVAERKHPSEQNLFFYVRLLFFLHVLPWRKTHTVYINKEVSDFSRNKRKIAWGVARELRCPSFLYILAGSLFGVLFRLEVSPGNKKVITWCLVSRKEFHSHSHSPVVFTHFLCKASHDDMVSWLSRILSSFPGVQTKNIPVTHLASVKHHHLVVEHHFLVLSCPLGINSVSLSFPVNVLSMETVFCLYNKTSPITKNVLISIRKSMESNLLYGCPFEEDA